MVHEMHDKLICVTFEEAKTADETSSADLQVDDSFYKTLLNWKTWITKKSTSNNSLNQEVNDENVQQPSASDIQPEVITILLVIGRGEK